MPEDGKEDEDEAGDGGGKRVACGKTLKPVHVKTRLPDLQGGSSQAKQRGREPKRDTEAFKLDYSTNLLVYHLTLGLSWFHYCDDSEQDLKRNAPL